MEKLAKNGVMGGRGKFLLIFYTLNIKVMDELNIECGGFSPLRKINFSSNFSGSNYFGKTKSRGSLSDSP
ncbi:hypothetical protein BJP41_04825 [Candidatus Williamhamiltonella defendens]|uniref:Uncharacterized protein n=1 Tax=Candidatus Williamhamiltonella defendens TaxID=138072 RepID=A0A2D3T1T0_9ENTR|nr:hypothetical protein BJP41_04825 [Candidatus Hamiltonella defensa]